MLIKYLKDQNTSKIILSLAIGLSASNAFAASSCCCIPCCPTSNVYIGVLGGWGQSTSTDLTQSATVFFDASRGGPLDVHATGSSSKNSTWILGGDVGYEWQGWNLGNCSTWRLKPAAEFEGYYLKNKDLNGQLLNPTPRIPGHTFDDTFPMNTGVFLGNAVFSLQSLCSRMISPYVGVGIGAAVVSISGATSDQIIPFEPNVNHFNSDTSARSWTFASQAKAGLRLNLNKRWRIFGEYRFLHLSPSNYTFGSTQYPTHAATTDWKVNFSGLNYNLGVVGVQWLIC